MLCGKDDQIGYRKDGEWMLVRCRNCDLIFLNPRPDPQELKQLYVEDYFAARNVQHDHSDSTVRQEINERIPSAKRIAGEALGPGSWLDIGCGSGYLLAAARDIGWSVKGVEISSWAGEFGRHSLDLPIHTGTLQTFQEADEKSKFDIITLMAYLEHSSNPLEDLRIVKTMLTEGGLVVIRVPNVSSFDRYWHGPKWWGWHLPFHLYHFSPNTLKHTLASSGLIPYRVDLEFWNPILHLKNAVRYADLRWDGPLEGRVPAGKDAIGKPEFNPPGWKAMIRKALGKALTGRDMIVYARKTE
jgi:SAM-dependent methyltransferase